MRRFFDREDTRWRRGNGALHFYLAPPEDSPLWDLVREAEKPLSAFPQIGIQPPECIHVTVQRLDLYRDEISDAQWEKLRSQMDPRMAQIDPFTLTFAPPAVQERAVEVISPENRRSDLISAWPMRLQGRVAKRIGRLLILFTL